jgi:hypothetical protein
VCGKGDRAGEGGREGPGPGPRVPAPTAGAALARPKISGDNNASGRAEGRGSRADSLSPR